MTLEICPSCNGVLGRDCWNPEECAAIAADAAQQQDDHALVAFLVEALRQIDACMDCGPKPSEIARAAIALATREPT